MAQENNIEAKNIKEATRPPADQFAETTQNAKTIFAAAANPYISTISKGHLLLLAMAKYKEEEQKIYRYITALTIQQETNARIEARIREEMLDDIRYFNTNFDNMSQEKRDEHAQKAVQRAADIAMEENPNLSDEEAIRVGTDNLIETAKEDGASAQIIDTYEKAEEALIKTNIQNEAAQNINLSITAKSYAREHQITLTNIPHQLYDVDPTILRAIEKREKGLDTKFSPEQKEMMAYSMAIPKQLQASKDLLKELEETQKALTEQIEGPDVQSLSHSMQSALKGKLIELNEAIDSQKNKIIFEKKIVGLIEEIQSDETDLFKDIDVNDIMTYITTERPDIARAYYNANDADNIQQTMEEIATEIGMSPEDIKKMGVQMQRMQEATELSAQTLEIIKEAGSRHDFLLDNTIKMATDQEVLRDSEGHAVHHNNELGLYYIQKDDNGDINRIKYTDPLEIAQLRAKAWDRENPQNYANEIMTASPFAPKLEDHEIDPENGFFETTQRNLSEAAIAKNMVTEDTKNLDNKNVTLAGTMGEGIMSAALQAVQTLATSPKTHEQIINGQENIKESFTTAATQESEEKSALQSEFSQKAPPENKGWLSELLGTKFGYIPNTDGPAQDNDNVTIKNAM